MPLRMYSLQLQLPYLQVHQGDVTAHVSNVFVKLYAVFAGEPSYFTFVSLKQENIAVF